MWFLTGAKIIWSVISGGGLQGVLKEIGGYLGKVSDNKTALAEAKIGADTAVTQAKIGAETSFDLAALKAHTDELNIQHEDRQFRWGWWGERYLMLFAALGPVIHSNAVYLDCIPFWHHEVGSWAIAKAPGIYADQELKVIASVIGYSVVRAGVAGLIGRFTSK